MSVPEFYLTVDVAEDLIYTNATIELGGKTITPVKSQQYEIKDWTVEYLQIIKIDGELFGFFYEEGLTEMATADYPFPGNQTIVPVFPAYGVETTVIEYGVKF